MKEHPEYLEMQSMRLAPEKFPTIRLMCPVDSGGPGSFISTEVAVLPASMVGKVEIQGNAAGLVVSGGTSPSEFRLTAEQCRTLSVQLQMAAQQLDINERSNEEYRAAAEKQEARQVLERASAAARNAQFDLRNANATPGELK